MSKAKVVKQPSGSAPITAEEKTLVSMYRDLSRWDKNFYFLILQSLAWGKCTSKTDKMSWDEIRRCSELPQSRKAVAHGS
jgi:hypothetical protein